MFVCTYAPDEPYGRVFEAARRLGEGVRVYTTGNPKGQRDALRALAPANVVLTGFVSEDEYVGLMRACDLIVDLTTQPDCLVCGAYEAVAAGKPLVLSDSIASRAYFSSGVVYCDNSIEGIEAAIRTGLAERDRLAAEIATLGERLAVDWTERRDRLVVLLSGLSRRSGRSRTTS